MHRLAQQDGVRVNAHRLADRLGDSGSLPSAARQLVLAGELGRWLSELVPSLGCPVVMLGLRQQLSAIHR
jgi:hypothetical protein